jgi:hypothetical protein
VAGMTNTELTLKAAESISLILHSNPEYTKEQLMFKAYMDGLAEGGNIVAGHVESYATIQKAKL